MNAEELARSVVGKERLRQREEGYDLESDMKHSVGEFDMAARAYRFEDVRYWPWEAEDFKLKSRIRNLTRAGALAMAGVERAKVGSNLDTFRISTVQRLMDECVKSLAVEIEDLTTILNEVLE